MEPMWQVLILLLMKQASLLTITLQLLNMPNKKIFIAQPTPVKQGAQTVYGKPYSILAPAGSGMAQEAVKIQNW